MGILTSKGTTREIKVNQGQVVFRSEARTQEEYRRMAKLGKESAKEMDARRERLG